MQTFVVDHVLLVVEGAPREQQGGGQHGHQDHGGEGAALGLGLDPGPAPTAVLELLQHTHFD